MLLEQRHRQHPGRPLAVGPVARRRPPVAAVVAVERLDHRVAGQARRRRPSTSSKGSRSSTASTQSETRPCSGVSPSGVGTGGRDVALGVPHVDGQAQRVEGQQLAAPPGPSTASATSARVLAPEPHQVHQLLHGHLLAHQVSPSASRIVASNSASPSVRRSSSTIAASVAHLHPQRRGRVLERIGHGRADRPRAPVAPRARPACTPSAPLGVEVGVHASGPGWSSSVLHPRSDVPGLDDHDPDPEVAELEVEGLRQRLERVLRCGVGPSSGVPILPCTELMFTSTPLPRSRQRGTTACAMRSGPDRVDLEDAGERVERVGLQRAVAGHARRCSRRRRARPRPPRRADRVGVGDVEREDLRRRQAPSRLASRAVATTSWPRPASTSTVARPMARAAPVTRTRTAQPAVRRGEADELLAHLPQPPGRLGDPAPSAGAASACT